MLGVTEFRKEVLRDGLFHSTTPCRYVGILRTGFIEPNPDIPDSERWKTSRGPDFYPFVRHIGGVSLFDFSDFEIESYSNKYLASSWSTFVPCRKQFPFTVWIEIERTSVERNFISPADLVQKWDAGGHHRHTIMPDLEAAHLGPIELAAFKRVLTVHAIDNEYEILEVENFRDVDCYKIILDQLNVRCT